MHKARPYKDIRKGEWVKVLPGYAFFGLMGSEGEVKKVILRPDMAIVEFDKVKRHKDPETYGYKVDMELFEGKTWCIPLEYLHVTSSPLETLCEKLEDRVAELEIQESVREALMQTASFALRDKQATIESLIEQIDKLNADLYRAKNGFN